MRLDSDMRLGAYEILSAIGAGGMGEVYRARHTKLGRDVAIKVLPSDLASDAERLKRFEREARSASALNHPNIVTIHDIAEHEGTTYIAMELIEGRTLRELLQDGPLPIAKTLAIATQICDGLGKAHAAGIVHRDLKPDNLMVTDDGLVKILDFGLAKTIAPEVGDDSKLSTLTKGTAAGVIVGTAYYMSPEQAAASPVDHRSDQFSLGVVLYELLCGQRPFEGSSVATVISAILRDTPSPPRSLRPDLPKELERIVERCLEKDPEKRYASAGDLRRDLLMVEERAAASKRRLARTLVVTALVVAVIAGVSWMWLRGSRARWAREEALPEIARLSDAGELYEAYRLAVEAKNTSPRTPTSKRCSSASRCLYPSIQSRMVRTSLSKATRRQALLGSISAKLPSRGSEFPTRSCAGRSKKRDSRRSSSRLLVEAEAPSRTSLRGCRSSPSVRVRRACSTCPRAFSWDGWAWKSRMSSQPSRSASFGSTSTRSPTRSSRSSSTRVGTTNKRCGQRRSCRKTKRFRGNKPWLRSLMPQGGRGPPPGS